MKIVIATTKSWNISNAQEFRDKHREHTVIIVSDKE